MGKKKEKEFDFDKTYTEFMIKAEESGLRGELVFETLMKEFKRIKHVCDELYKGIEEAGASYVEEGSMGQSVYKTNPCVKDYVSAHKTLVSTCNEIREMLAKVPQSNDSDW